MHILGIKVSLLETVGITTWHSKGPWASEIVFQFILGGRKYYLFFFKAYCDMTSSGEAWTLIARFSNNDPKFGWKTVESGGTRYKSVGVGDIADPSVNADMLSPAFWLVRGREFKITRSCCRPQVTLWVERHSARKSPVMVTLEMV